MNKWGTNNEYYHDYIGNRTYIFNILENRDIPNYRTLTSYNNNKKGTLYNFIHSDKVKLNIDDDIDVKSIKDNKYTTLEKIEKYESEYGTCYILKAVKSTKTNYIMYMENKNKKTQGELDAILFDSDLDREGYFSDDNKAINSYKNILPER